MSIVYRQTKGEKLTIEEMDANFQYLEDNISITPDVTFYSLGGLQFRVRATLYSINGTAYSAPETDITLDAAHATLDRFDLLIAKSDNTVSKITGIASVAPAIPDIDESLEYQVAVLLVNAAATTVDGVTEVDIYKENTEWTTTENTSTARIVVASVNDSFAGTKSIEGTNVIDKDFVEFEASSVISASTITILKFRLKIKTAFGAGSYLALVWSDEYFFASNTIYINDGDYGFSNSDTTNWQEIAIPVSGSFSFFSDTVLKLTIKQVGISVGWFIDDVIYQTGISEAVLPTSVSAFGNWKFIEGSFVEKGSGKTSTTVLEPTDDVYFKKITNAGDPLTLIGHTYDGGDTQLRTSYTQNQVIDI